MEPQKYVLYADDDIDDREMLQDVFLSYPDYTLLTFKDGEHLLQHLNEGKRESVCLVVLDVNMPLLNGMKTLQQIRSNNQFVELPVVMFTTSSSPLDKQEAAHLKAKVITKPTSFAQLKEVTTEMLNYCSDYLSE